MPQGLAARPEAGRAAGGDKRGRRDAPSGRVQALLEHATIGPAPARRRLEPVLPRQDDTAGQSAVGIAPHDRGRLHASARCGAAASPVRWTSSCQWLSSVRPPCLRESMDGQ